MSANDDIKFLENIKKGFKITISWNKYRFEITTQPKNNNLDHVIDSTFRNISKNDPKINYFDKYYMSLIEIKYFNALIDSKLSIQKHIKNLLKCQETVTMQQKTYWITYTMRNTINSLVWIYHNKQIKVFLNKLILQEN